MGDLGLPSSLERASDSGSRSTSWKIKSVILSATRIMIMIVNPHAQSDQSLGVTEVVEPISRVCQRNSQLEAYTKRINYSIQLTTTLASWRLFWSEFGPHQSPFPIPVGHLSTDAVPIKKGVLELVARGRHTIHQSLPKDPKKVKLTILWQGPTTHAKKKCNIGKIFDLNEQLGLQKFCTSQQVFQHPAHDRGNFRLLHLCLA